MTRARITQIMNLLHLAAPIQEEILHWPAAKRDPVSERALRRLTQIPSWSKQLSCGANSSLQLTGQPVSRLSLIALEAGDLQAQVVDQGAADEAPDGMRLPLGHAHDLGDGGAVGPLQHADDLRLLGARAYTGCLRTRAALAGSFGSRLGMR